MTPKHHLISGRQCSPDHPVPCRCHRYAALCIEKCQTPRRANLAWQISLQRARSNIFATSNVSSRPCIFALPHFSPNGFEVWSSFCGANGQQSIPPAPTFLFCWVTLRARLNIFGEMAQKEELRMHVKFLAVRQASWRCQNIAWHFGVLQRGSNITIQ